MHPDYCNMDMCLETYQIAFFLLIFQLVFRLGMVKCGFQPNIKTGINFAFKNWYYFEAVLCSPIYGVGSSKQV